MQDDTAVHLQLGFTRSAQSYRALAATRTRAATLTLQVGPQPLQTGQHIPILGQFDLCLGLGGLGTHGKDVEDERRAVQYLDLQLGLDIAYLLGRQLIVEDDHTYRLGHHAPLLGLGRTVVAPLVVGILLLLDVLLDLLELSLSDIRHLTGPLHLLRETLDGDCPGSISQKFQLVEIFFRLGLVLLLRDESHQYRSLGLHF